MPSVDSITVSRIDGSVPSAWATYIQGYSKASVVATASGAYGSTIKSYSISGGGYAGTSATLTTGYLTTSGTNTFTVTVMDTRNRSASSTASITVEPYTIPSLTLYSANRCLADNT